MEPQTLAGPCRAYKLPRTSFLAAGLVLLAAVVVSSDALGLSTTAGVEIPAARGLLSDRKSKPWDSSSGKSDKNKDNKDKYDKYNQYDKYDRKKPQLCKAADVTGIIRLLRSILRPLLKGKIEEAAAAINVAAATGNGQALSLAFSLAIAGNNGNAVAQAVAGAAQTGVSTDAVSSTLANVINPKKGTTTTLQNVVQAAAAGDVGALSQAISTAVNGALNGTTSVKATLLSKLQDQVVQGTTRAAAQVCGGLDASNAAAALSKDIGAAISEAASAFAGAQATGSISGPDGSLSITSTTLATILSNAAGTSFLETVSKSLAASNQCSTINSFATSKLQDDLLLSVASGMASTSGLPANVAVTTLGQAVAEAIQSSLAQTLAQVADPTCGRCPAA